MVPNVSKESGTYDFPFKMGKLAEINAMVAKKRFPKRDDRVAAPKRRRYPSGYLALLGVFLFCLAEVPAARGDFGSCIANASAYVAELDELLSREQDRLGPYDDLNERYLPFHDCEADALVEVVKRSRFIRLIDYHPPTKEYYIYFSSDYVRVSFMYLVAEKRSKLKTVLWVHK